MFIRKAFLTAALFLMYWIQAAAQQYPVQVTTQLLPPYTLQVSEYYSPLSAGAQKMQLMLLNRDLLKPQLSVRLRLTIESNSIRIRTREDVSFTPISLTSGTPYYVTPSELTQYFNPDNLEFSGISRQQYEATGKLPEGFYTFCIEAVEINTVQTVSNKGCGMAWMTLNEPPLLNLPRKAESVSPRNPQNLIFQWTPRHTASPTAAFNTDYIFSIVELADNALSPEQGFAVSQPLYIDSTSATTYLYDATKPQLIPGKRYAWRVQAKAKSGTEDMALFRNQGYSETWWFTYMSTCPVPTGISTTAQGQRITIQWQASQQHLEYKVEYREKNNADAEWFTVSNILPRVQLNDVKPGKMYEYRVGAACEVDIYNYSDLLSFTTNSDTVSNISNCGDSSGIPSTVVQNNLQTLSTGDIIRAGDFDVTVTQTTGSNGSFSGEGYVMVPWLANMKIGVRFTNIGINSDKKLYNGVIQTIYDPTESGIVDIDGLIDMLTGGIIGKDLDFPLTPNSINVNPTTGVIIIRSSTGQTNTFPGGVNYTFTGTNGTTYTVDQKGHINGPFTQAPGGPANPSNTDGVNSNGVATSITASGVKVSFDKDISSTYVFDKLSPAASGEIEKLYEKLGNDYKVYKAVENQKNDKIVANITVQAGNENLVDSLVFKTQKGILIESVKQDNTYILNLKGTFNYGEEEVLATLKQNGKWQVAGAFKLIHISAIKIKVVLIPLNNSQIPSGIKNHLINTFKAAAVTVDVVDGATLQTNLQQIEVGNTHFLENYTDDQQSLNQQIKDRADYDKNAYYIFYSDVPPSNPQVQGFMALKGQFGYIFSNAPDKTITHELAHGAFGLEHPVKSQTADLGSGWLMDYGVYNATTEQGALLSHIDLKQINNPAFKLYLFQNDKAGLFSTAHLTPEWKPFKFGNSKTYYSNEGIIPSPNGAVYGIVVSENGTQKNYTWDTASKTYTAPGVTKPLVINLISNAQPTLPINLFWNRGTCGLNEIYGTTWGFISNKQGVNIDNITDPGIKFLQIVPCAGDKAGEASNDNGCKGKDVAQLNQQRLALEALINVNDISALVTKVNTTDICALKKLSYTNIDIIIGRIESQFAITETDEKAIVKLMCCIEPKDFVTFYSFLTANNKAKLNHLLAAIQNTKLYFFGDDNYNTFIRLLSEMISTFNGDVIKWDFINNLIKERYNKINDEEQLAMENIFSSMDMYSSIKAKIPEITKLFREMLIKDCEDLNDYKIVFTIAAKRNDNREIFSYFTQSDMVSKIRSGNMSTTQTGEISWVKPKPVRIAHTIIGYGQVDADIPEYELYKHYEWSNYLKNNPAVAQQFDDNLPAYIATLNAQFDICLIQMQQANEQFWVNYSLNDCNNLKTALDQINAKENFLSLKKVDKTKRLSILTELFNCNVYDANSIIANTDDALMKLATSFEPEDKDVIAAIENIGIDKIYNIISGERLNKFLFWIGGQLVNSNSTKPLPVNQLLSSTGELKNTDDMLHLESDLVSTENFSSSIQSKTKITTKLGTLDYNQEVLVYVSGSFDFIEQKFKQGTVMKLPLIQAFAMSNSNRNIVYEKSAWIGVDAVTFFIGLGEIKVVFKAGNILRKAITLADIAGGATGAIVQGINEDAISPQLRAKIQMLSLIASLPQLATSFKKVKNLVTAADDAINELRGITSANKAEMLSYVERIKLRIIADDGALIKFLDKIKLPSYSSLYAHYNSLTPELKTLFYTDFINAEEKVLEQLNKQTSELFSGWKTYRGKYPDKIICN